MRPKRVLLFHNPQKEYKILEGRLVLDYVYILIEIPPKHPVSSVIGFLKGKIVIATYNRVELKNMNM